MQNIFYELVTLLSRHFCITDTVIISQGLIFERFYRIIISDIWYVTIYYNTESHYHNPFSLQWTKYNILVHHNKLFVFRLIIYDLIS